MHNYTTDYTFKALLLNNSKKKRYFRGQFWTQENVYIIREYYIYVYNAEKSKRKLLGINERIRISKFKNTD